MYPKHTLVAALFFSALASVAQVAPTTASNTTATVAVSAMKPGPSTTTPSDSNYKAHPDWNQSCEKEVAAMQGKPCDVIFIGDSITQNFIARPSRNWTSVGKDVWDKHYAGRNALDFGVGADATQNVLWRMDHMDIKTFKPKVAVVMIGTNNTQNTPAEIAAGVKAVVEKTQGTFPGVKVILISILPNARATQKMADANAIIKTFGDDKSVYYFDLAAKMTPEGNSWKGLGPDRLHLSPEGYELWASAMEPLLTKLLAGKN